MDSFLFVGAAGGQGQDTVQLPPATLLASPGRGILVYSPILLFSLAGAILGFRKPIYRWSAVAAFAYPIAIGNLEQWSGNECFGARKLAETLPLWAVLLVPTLDAVVRSRPIRALFLAAVAWSVAVQLLGAAMWQVYRVGLAYCEELALRRRETLTAELCHD